VRKTTQNGTEFVLILGIPNNKKLPKSYWNLLEVYLNFKQLNHFKSWHWKKC